VLRLFVCQVLNAEAVLFAVLHMLRWMRWDIITFRFTSSLVLIYLLRMSKADAKFFQSECAEGLFVV